MKNIVTIVYKEVKYIMIQLISWAAEQFTGYHWFSIVLVAIICILTLDKRYLHPSEPFFQGNLSISYMYQKVNPLQSPNNIPFLKL